MTLEQLLLNLFTLQSNAVLISNALDRRIHSYRKQRRQCLLNILRAYRKKQALLKRKRSIWTKTRTSKFWEEDVPKNGDQFFKENFRTNRENFEILCFHLRHLKKNDTRYRKSIPLDKRVAIAFYTLGSSAEYRSVANLFGVGKCTVGNILHEFCEEVWKVLHPIYLSAYPLTEERIKENVVGFSKLGFPQCFGAIDGCHIEIRPAAENAVDYYNYKGWYSTVLLAVVDYRYRLLYISVGSPGRCNDSSIFESSSLKVHHQDPILKAMSKNLCDVNVPVVLIGDSAFRFSDILMKPYPYSTSLTPKEKNFNFHLSKSRRVVENAFGHLKARFRRIGKGLDNHIENTNLIIKSCCVLHNFLNTHNDEINHQWIQRSRETIIREQPEFNSIINDTNPTAINIRNAITNYLGLDLEVDALDDGSGLSDVDDGDGPGFSVIDRRISSMSSSASVADD